MVDFLEPLHPMKVRFDNAQVAQDVVSVVISGLLSVFDSFVRVKRYSGSQVNIAIPVVNIRPTSSRVNVALRREL